MSAFSRAQRNGICRRPEPADEQRWARGQLDKLPALLADLIRRRVSVLMTTGGTAARLRQKTGRQFRSCSRSHRSG